MDFVAGGEPADRVLVLLLVRFVELIAHEFVKEIPADEFSSGGGPVVFALEVVPVSGAGEFFMLSGVER